MATSSKYRNVAIIGINRDSAALFQAIHSMSDLGAVLIVNNTAQDLKLLARVPEFDIIVNASRDQSLAATLKDLSIPVEASQIISVLSAKLLFSARSSGNDERDLEKQRILCNLREVADAVYLSKNKEELLKVILTLSIKTCYGDSGSIMLADSNKKFLHIEIADGIDSTIIDSTRQKVGKGVAGKVFRTRRPVIIHGNKEDLSNDSQRTDIVSSMCAPLAIGEEVVGVININSKAQQRVFHEEDLEYLVTLADFTASIIKASKDFENTSESTFMLSLLNSARDIMNLSYDFDEKITLLTMKIANVFKAEICNYYRFNKRTNAFYIKASSLFTLNLLKGKTLKLNDFITKKAVVADDTVCLSIFDKKNNIKKWYLAQPLFSGTELTGLLYMHLIVDKESLTEESRLLGKIGALVSKELGKCSELEISRMQSIKYSAISEVSFDIASVSGIEELLKIVVSNACLIMEADTCIMRMPNPYTSELEIVQTFSMQGETHPVELDQLDSILSAEAAKIRSFILVSDIGDSPDYQRFIDVARSALCMAIVRNGTFLGTISLFDKKSLDLFEYRSFTQKDADVFMNFCLQVSKALMRFMS